MRIIVFIIFTIAIGTLAAIVALLVWRRRQPSVVTNAAPPWVNERTLFATTYEQVGVAAPAPPAPREDSTACLAYEELGLEPTPIPEATALVSMDALFSAAAPVAPVQRVEGR